MHKRGAVPLPHVITARQRKDYRYSDNKRKIIINMVTVTK